MENTNPGSFYSPRQSRNMLLGGITLLTILLLVSALPIISALLGAIVFYILFKPFFMYLHKKKHMGSSLSAALVLATSFLLIVLPLLALGWMMLTKLADLQKNPEIITNLINKVTDLTGSTIDKKELIRNSLNDVSKWIIGIFSLLVNRVAHIFISLLILYFTLFFMFCSYAEFEATLIRYLPFKKEQSLMFGKELKNVTYSNIFGQGIIAVSQCIIVITGFLIFGIPDPLFWGVIALFVCFLPVVGAPLVIVPAGVIELASGHTTAGVGILIWGLVLVTIVDNFLRQYISRKIADTHPLITIIGVIIGIPVFGIVGIVMGPLLISFVLLLIKTYELNYAAAEKDVQTDPKKDGRSHEL